MISKERIIASVTILNGSKNINVLWSNVILENGVEIAPRTNHRREYMESEKEQFLADVPGGEIYAQAAGWA